MTHLPDVFGHELLPDIHYRGGGVSRSPPCLLRAVRPVHPVPAREGARCRPPMIVAPVGGGTARRISPTPDIGGSTFDSDNLTGADSLTIVWRVRQKHWGMEVVAFGCEEGEFDLLCAFRWSRNTGRRGSPPWRWPRMG